jgi:hypothetical protein
MKNTCNNEEGIQNPEKQPTLVAGKQSNGKSRIKPKLPSALLTRLAVSFLFALGLVSFTTFKAVAASDLQILASQVDALFADSVPSNIPGTAVLIARDGKKILEKGFQFVPAVHQ